MGLVIVINFLSSYTDLRIQETFPITKRMCWALVGTRQRMLRDNGFAVSVDSSVAIRTASASRSGGQDRRDLEQFVTSQCLFFVCTSHYAFSANSSIGCYFALCAQPQMS